MTKLYWDTEMINRFFIFLLPGVLALSFQGKLQAQTLAVENVRFQQEIDSKVVVTYDLIGKTSQKYTVILSIFIPGSRKKVPISMRSLNGAVGKAVSPGKDLEIVWDLNQDYPDGLEGEGFRFIVDAYIQQKSGSNKWPWIVVGIAAAGGAAILLTGSSTTVAEEPDLPTPPILPPNR
jgi:hypothetical protein